MKGENFSPGRIFMERLPYEGDLLITLNTFCRDQGIQAGVFSLIGAAKVGAFTFYDQANKTYGPVVLKEDLEIVGCLGNVSLLEGKPWAHAHISFSRPNGETLCGHLIEGTILFAGELFLKELLGPPRIRKYDPVTGLNLWVV